MNQAIICCAFLLSSFYAIGQGLEKSRCKSSEVEIGVFQAQDQPGEVVYRVMTLHTHRVVHQADELTEKETRVIQKQARKYKSCKVLLDSDGLFVEKAKVEGIPEGHLTYLIIRERRNHE